MKKTYIPIFILSLLISSCAIHLGKTSNVNNHTTTVVLSRNNYKIVQNVTGEVQATYFFGLIGGLSRKNMLAAARAKMLSKVNFEGSSKAIINENFEIKHSMNLIVRKMKVTVTAQIIEFTE